MQYFPIFIDTTSLTCLIVGAGSVAARKLELVLKTEAQIIVVAEHIDSAVATLAQSSQVTIHQRKFKDSDLANIGMVFVCTADAVLNQHISVQAKQQNILVNVVDKTQLCQFITPSIIDRSPITIALSSGGAAPVLLRHLRQKLESIIPQGISKLGAFAQASRDTVKRALSSVTARRNFWEGIFEGDVAELVEKNQHDKAQALFDKTLAATVSGEKHVGEVYLVGAGPGDADLLTFRALRLMQKADVVIYDRLVSPQILELVRRDAEKLYVGKAKSLHTVPQNEINTLIVEKAKQGQRVVRLKGGDPFIFGRGGEEIASLVDAGIGFQVVPGITAANGASSYAGIPLTHRDHAQSVVFATGHLKDDTVDLNWSALAHANQTIVFYMGLTGLSIICQKLIAHGLSKDTHIALIENATMPEQRVVAGTLNNIESLAQNADIQPPALIIVGSVVSLHSSLNWYNSQKTKIEP
ncbi:siroheme synthase CysG [Alteromonas sp. ASW11-130]|uniref:siroheme synthase CysG n=1 Tax=Alteromonas sp. ASW11-130 TaxID=3015775 RepID=UPI0022425069|nr:siroheme synthase CysG [Alteromonas sp. ASW11-130]MCW8090553.1 siroheme synthase CysG [Alteromonas sp. ASW11-130]